MLGRRPFLIGCGGLVAVPVLAQLATPATGALSAQPVLAALPASAVTDAVAGAQDFVLRIHGWELPEDSDPAARNEAWIHINSSWRAAWR